MPRNAGRRSEAVALWTAAASLIRARSGNDVTIDLSGYKGLRVTRDEYAIKHVTADADEATATVAFSYYYVDTGRVRELVEDTNWWYDAAAKRWYLDGTLPRFEP